MNQSIVNMKYNNEIHYLVKINESIRRAFIISQEWLMGLAIYFFIILLTDVGRKSSSQPLKRDIMKDKELTAEKRRNEIIKGARKLFSSKDYDSVTMQELTGRLNIARGTVYYYFTSKDELLDAVIEDIVTDELSRKKALLSNCSDKNQTALEKLKVLITEDEVLHSKEKILYSLQNPENALIYSKHLGRYINELAPIYASVFIQGCEEGVFKIKYPLECAEFIIAGVRFLTESGFYPWNELQITRRIKAIPFLIEAQLSALASSLLLLNENKINIRS